MPPNAPTFKIRRQRERCQVPRPHHPARQANLSRNAVKHGFLAQSLVLPGESRDRFNELTNALIAEFRPETTVEHMHVQT